MVTNNVTDSDLVSSRRVRDHNGNYVPFPVKQGAGCCVRGESPLISICAASILVCCGQHRAVGRGDTSSVPCLLLSGLVFHCQLAYSFLFAEFCSLYFIGLKPMPDDSYCS